MIVAGVVTPGDEEAAAADLAFLLGRGERGVLVHGAVADAERLPALLGPLGPEGALLALLHRNKEIAARVGAVAAGPGGHSGAAGAGGILGAGLSGADAGLLAGEGSSVTASAALLRALFPARVLPVVAAASVVRGALVPVPVASASAALAVALHAEALLLLGAERGLLDDAADLGSLRKTLARADAAEAAVAFPQFRSRLDCAVSALAGGVGRVVIGASGIPQPVLRALEGHGTVLR